MLGVILHVFRGVLPIPRLAGKRSTLKLLALESFSYSSEGSDRPELLDQLCSHQPA